MRELICVGIVLLLAGCTFPGFDYDTEPEYPEELETDPLQVVAVPEGVGVGEQLVVRAVYSYEGELIDGATCVMTFESTQIGMSYSQQGYQGNIDTGGMDAGTYSVGVKCSKPGYSRGEGGTTFTVVESSTS